MSQSPDPSNCKWTGRRHAGHGLEISFLQLSRQGQGRGVRKKYALHISEVTAFAFKAEICSLSSQQLQLGRIGKLSEASPGHSREETDFARLFWDPRQVTGDPIM